MEKHCGGRPVTVGVPIEAERELQLFGKAPMSELCYDNKCGMSGPDDLETLLEHAVSLARSPDDVMERMCTTTSTELLREDQIEQPVKLSSVKGRHRNS